MAVGVPNCLLTYSQIIYLFIAKYLLFNETTRQVCTWLFAKPSKLLKSFITPKTCGFRTLIQTALKKVFCIFCLHIPLFIRGVLENIIEI